MITDTNIKTFDFKPLPIEIEVKDLKFVKELPKLLGRPHKVTFYQMVWLTGGEATFRIDFREVRLKANEMVVILPNQVCQSGNSTRHKSFTTFYFSK